MRTEISDGQKIAFDIVFIRNIHGREETFAIEVKEMSAVTDQRIVSITYSITSNYIRI